MSIVRHQPAKILSGAVEANGMVYVAGTVADKRPASVKAQTEEILGRIDALLAQAGSHKSKIVSAQIWLADIRTREEMNQAWLAWVDRGQPAGARLRRGQACGRRHAGRDRGDRGEVGRRLKFRAGALDASFIGLRRARRLRAGTRLARVVGARRAFCRAVAGQGAAASRARSTPRRARSR